MDNQKNLLPILPTLFLAGLCSCDPEDVEQPLDEDFDVIEDPGITDISPEDFDEEPDLGEEPGLDEIDANEPETAEVINDPLEADFNNDGYADLAIGVPKDDESGVASGSVNVIYGSATGLRTQGLTAEVDQIWHHDNIFTDGTAQIGDNFGWALAAGDFNGDGVSDLAIGAPGDLVGADADAGSVTILYGRQNVGLTNMGPQIWTQDSTLISDDAEPDDRFGDVLASGNFDNDAADDLAIGVPREDILSVPSGVNAGAVSVIYGAVGTGLVAAGNQFLYQGAGGGLTAGAETPAAGDRLGNALAAGDFDEDDNDDLAIGVPGEDRNVLDVGVVHVVYGSSPDGLSTGTMAGTPLQQLWEQGSGGILDTAELNDDFGTALAAGDFDNNGAHDLAVGVPLEDVSGDLNAGAVNVIYGADIIGTGLTADGNQFWHQDVVGVEGSTDLGDFFGAALAAGNFDGNTRDDLAIGNPGENLGDDSNAGAVNVLYGFGTSGLSSSGDQRWNQDTDGILDFAEDDDQFGAALSSGDFDNDGATDLVIGVPFEGLQGDIEAAGAVNVLYGVEGLGIDDVRDQLWHQDRTDAFGDVAGVADEDEYFGAALAESAVLNPPPINIMF
jgi:hypothetical protein